MQPKMVRPDAKGRITLGHLANGVSRYSITETKDHKLVLEPYSELPSREVWTFKTKRVKDKKTLKMLEPSLKQSKEGRVSYQGSFAKYDDDDSD